MKWINEILICLIIVCGVLWNNESLSQAGYLKLDMLAINNRPYFAYVPAVTISYWVAQRSKPLSRIIIKSY